MRARKSIVSLLVPSLLGLLSAGLLVGVPAPATADTGVVQDPAGDTWFFSAQEGDDWQQVPDRTTNDVTSLRIEHSADGLVLTTTMRRVPGTDESPGAGPRFTIVRARGRHLGVYTNVSGDGPDIGVGIGSHAAPHCGGQQAQLEVRRRAGKVIVTLGRRCLGRQAWVRVESCTTSPTGRNYYRDAVGNDGHDAGTLSPRIGS